MNKQINPTERIHINHRIAELHATGKTNNEIEEIVGLDRDLVRGRLAKMGLRSNKPVKKYGVDPRSAIQYMDASDAVEYLLDYINTLTRPEKLAAFIQENKAFDLTPIEAEIMQILLAHESEFVSRRKIYNTLYGLKCQDQCPEPEVISAYMYRLRRKIAEFGYRIDNQRSIGYRITREVQNVQI